ncbi:MAG TPA: regulatory protein RecX [Candidatus Acidoferrum sp.]|nr:regulatory protein RecX [Candidatus Acidoferrum sp.]
MRTARARRPAPTAQEPDSADAAYAEAVKRLGRQPQSRAMLRDRLRRVGYSEPAVAAALDLAQQHGYLDDAEYAASIVRRRSATRGHGLIAQELRAKGIDDGEAESALAQVEPEAELDRALAMGRKMLASKRLADGNALLAFLAPRLARRGFRHGMVYRVCRRLAAEFETARLFDSHLEQN